MPTLTQPAVTVSSPSVLVPRKSLGQRLSLLLWVALALGLTAVAANMVYTHLSEQAAERSRESRSLQLQNLASDLQAEDSPYIDTVTASIHLLRDNTLALGQPNVGPAKVTVGKETALPDLRFGNHSVVNDFTVVDEVTKALGGTATLFVKSGDRFIRVTTTVVTSEGARAIGTELDPKGAAIATIREGKIFTGVVDVLGKSYFAIYEPIHAASGETIGIWYVGVPVLATK